MSERIETRLAALGISLPLPQQPRVARILPWAIAGELLFVSGQLPQWQGDVRYVGKLGVEFDLDQGREAARLSALNVLAQARAALDGDLDRIRRIVRLGGFVNCTADFTGVAQVVNGASELFLDVFGEAGAHARTAVGAANMPMGVAVEIEAIMQIAG
ncbi:MAG: RidA family protein [Gammaproteobacteria bacterium]|nr:RidA family protein [Gammaproteobacteria bacterium]